MLHPSQSLTPESLLLRTVHLQDADARAANSRLLLSCLAQREAPREELAACLAQLVAGAPAGAAPQRAGAVATLMLRQLVEQGTFEGPAGAHAWLCLFFPPRLWDGCARQLLLLPWLQQPSGLSSVIPKCRLDFVLFLCAD